MKNTLKLTSIFFFILVFCTTLLFICASFAGGVKTAQVPCYVEIAAGGELRVPIDTDRQAYLDIINEANGESVFVVYEYQNGNLREGCKTAPSSLEKKGYRKSWEFNEARWQDEPYRLVDEVRIKADKGLVYAKLIQKGKDRTDSYNSGGQSDHGVDPKRPLKVQIAGDNPFGNQTSGKFWLMPESGEKSEAIPFTVENGKTLTWDCPADKKIETVVVFISEGNGQAKISLIQPSDSKKAAPEQTTVQKAPQPQYAPKPVTEFTVAHPSGTSKPVSPGKDLTITVTGVSSDASGSIMLYTDRNKTKQIDEFKFKLKKNQAESFAVSGNKNAGWASVWVHKGSFKVKLDQSHPIKAAPTPKPKKSEVAAVSGTDKQPPASGAILNGEVPLYNGAKVIKTSASGPYAMAELQANASPQEVVDFYKQAMSAKGWEAAMAMVQGNKGMLMCKQAGRQLVFKVKGQGNTSKVDITLMGQ